MTKSTRKPVVVIPNLNGGAEIIDAIQSLFNQTLEPHIIVVDNASTDGSPAKILETFPAVELVRNRKNRGYAGGVNPGLKLALERNAKYVGVFNNDAVADKRWLEMLVTFLDSHPAYGAADCKILRLNQTIDSVGVMYSSWGLPFPRGRDEEDKNQYDALPDVFAASGAASLLRVSALREIGLFDEAFFAYYEDVDLGFRLQNAGWKISTVPGGIVHHKVGMTSQRIPGFYTYQTMKNLPLVFWKNMPIKLLPKVLPRFCIAYFLFFVSATRRANFLPASRGMFESFFLLLRKTPNIWAAHLSGRRKVRSDFIWSIITHDLPPKAYALRRLRSHFKQ